MSSTTAFEGYAASHGVHLGRPLGGFHVVRVQRNVVARHERLILDGLCRALPSAVTPDHLTLLGIAGAVVTCLGYLASRFDSNFLWIASLGLAVHWLGDSLDGSLARHRRIERPVYGYFLDHTIDALSNLIIMLGVGLSLYVRMDIALFALVGYYLLCIYVFINNHLSGVLQLSFAGCGPTELRLGLIGINTGMYFCGGVGLRVGLDDFTVYDGILFAAGSIFIMIFVSRTFAGLRVLREPREVVSLGTRQSASRKASSLA